MGTAPTLTDDDERIVLNMPQVGDAEALEACHDADWCWAFWKAAKPSPEQTLRDIHHARSQWGRRNSRDRSFAIRQSAEGGLIGLIRIHPSHRDSKGAAQIDIELAPDHRGSGNGSAALRVVLGYVFETLDYVIAEMEIRPGNGAMEHLASKFKFRLIGPRGMSSGAWTNAYQLRIHAWRWARDRSRT